MPFKDPEKRKEYLKRHYRENIDKYKEKARQWEIDNPEKVKLRGATRYSKNPEKEKARVDAWKDKNRDYYREHSRLYMKRRRLENPGKDWRTRAYKIPGSCTLKEWEQKLKECGYKCSGCGVTGVRLTRDHIIPVTQQGSTNYIWNLQPLCLSCNSSKRNRLDWTSPIARAG